MTTHPRPKRRNYSAMHLGMSHVALISLITFIVAYTYDPMRWAGGIAILCLLAAIITMFLTRDSDEYIAGLWQAGANAGFVTAVVFLVFAPFFEGLIDGYLGREATQDFPAESVGVLAVIVFLIVFNWKRYFGTA